MFSPALIETNSCDGRIHTRLHREITRRLTPHIHLYRTRLLTVFIQHKRITCYVHIQTEVSQPLDVGSESVKVRDGALIDVHLRQNHSASSST
jgi:hypothetical protein